MFKALSEGEDTEYAILQQQHRTGASALRRAKRGGLLADRTYHARAQAIVANTAARRADSDPLASNTESAARLRPGVVQEATPDQNLFSQLKQ